MDLIKDTLVVSERREKKLITWRDSNPLPQDQPVLAIPLSRNHFLAPQLLNIAKKSVTCSMETLVSTSVSFLTFSWLRRRRRRRFKRRDAFSSSATQIFASRARNLSLAGVSLSLRSTQTKKFVTMFVSNFFLHLSLGP